MIETRILGALVMDNSLISECSLTVDDFTDQAHKTVYTEIQRLAIQRQPYDVVYLADRLTEKTGQDWIGFIGGMVGDCALPKTFPRYVEKLKHQSHARRAKAVGETLADDGNPDAAITALMALQANTGSYTGNVTDAVKAAVEGVKAAVEGKASGVMTGISDLDTKLGGLHKSDLIVIGARPSIGKTAVMLNMANNCKVPCGVISAEQSMEQIGQRLLAINGAMTVHRMRNGRLEDGDWGRLQEVQKELDGRSMYINDKPGMSLDDVRRTARSWKYHNDIQVLFIDYIQKLRGTKENKREEVSEIVTGLKDLAKELDIPVVALAQVRREVENKNPPIPYMADLAESGVIEREADQVITLYRENATNKNTPDDGTLDLILCKNRHGPIGTIRTYWKASYMQVRDYVEQWYKG